MGKALAKQIKGMSWTAKISLVMIFTLLVSVFMYQGWYQPRHTEAATVTYGVTVPGTSTVGIDGSANLSATGTITTAPTVRGLMSTTYTTSASSYRPTTGMANGTAVVMMKLYGPAYAAATTISAPSGTFAVRGYNATDKWTFHLYAYNPTGTAGNKTLIATSSTITSGTGSTVAAAPTYTLAASPVVPAGSRLLLEIGYTPGGTTYTPRIYLDGTTSTAYSRLTVTESAATVSAPTITSISPTSMNQGATAQTLTINGTNLTGATAVTVSATGKTGITLGSPTVVSASQITIPVTVSATATTGTYNVAVTTPGGTATLTNGFTVNAVTASPTITSISPTSMNQGATAQTLTINGTNLTGATAVTVSATGKTGITLGSPTVVSASQITIPVTVSATATTGTYNVAVTTPGGTATLTNGFTVNTAAVNGTTVGAMTFTAISATSISLQVAFTGDANANNSCVITWGTSNGSYPNTATATRGSGVYTATISGLTNGTTYFFNANFSDADGITGTNPVTGSTVATTWTNSPLLHNSQNMGSVKWAANGGWGIPGGQYGAITCSTCHSPTTTNIKRVTTKLPAVFKPASTVKFRSTTAPDGFGDDSVTHASSLKICETCHTQTKYHNNNSASSTNLTHNNNADCTTSSCHPHSKGFRANATTCDSCHGNPPTTGNHSRHSGTIAGVALTCDACHGPHPDTAHVNNNVSWDLSAISATATYRGTNTGSTGAPMPSATYGACSNIYCHSNSGPNAAAPTYASPTWGGAALTCGSCHADMSSTASTAPNGGHYAHASTGNSTGPKYSCATCHAGYTATASNAATHVNKQVELAMTGATYSKTSPMAAGTAFGTCTGTCHGSATAITWGGALFKSGTDSCSTCHSSSTAGAVTAAAPFYRTGSTKVTATTDAKVGTHTAHVAGTHTLAAALTCDACHGTVNFTTATHMTGTTNFTWSAVATGNGALAPSYNSATGQCTNVYCHGAKMPNGDTSGNTKTPTWNAAILTGVATNDCAKCHGYPPATTTHTGVTATGCSTCHANVNSTGTGFINAALHINGIFEPPSTGCTSCHNVAVNSPIAAALNAAVATRPAITTEFGLTWSHKRAAAGVVTDADCCVCHMEGDVATGTPNASFHKDGYIQLRNADTGATIKAVTHTGTATAAGNFVDTATDAKFVRFSRNLAVLMEAETATIPGTTLTNFQVLGGIEVNHCLSCHDGDGATSALARVATGTPAKPFGTSVASTATYFNYSVAATSAAGSVMNVKHSFRPTNASYHPVLGKQNNSYAAGTKMIAPFNVTKTAGNNTQYGPLMSCWDCHGAAGATGTQTRTVTAHGGATTLRAEPPTSATAASATTTLCILCHATTYATSTTNHGSGTSWSTGGEASRYTVARCVTCHGTGLTTRPWPGVDWHGFNRWNESRTDTVTPANSFKSGNAGVTTAGHRPYNFIRSNNLGHVNPNTVPATDGTWTASGNKPGCVRSSTYATGYSCGNGHGTTGPGGVY